MESLEEWAVRGQINGKDIMPNLKRFASEAKYFPHFMEIRAGGGSSDAEAAVLLSLLPYGPHSRYLHNLSHLTSLPRALKRRGYHTSGLHSHERTYYNRDDAYPQMGFDRFLGGESFTEAASGWTAIDMEFFREALPVLESQQEPFFSLLISMEGHWFYDRERTSDYFGPFDETIKWPHYYVAAHTIDAGLGLFIDGLKETGLIERSVIILYSDHTAGESRCPYTVPRCLPLLVYYPGVEPSVEEYPVSGLDIAPTVFHLLGLRERRAYRWLGSSVLDEGTRRAWKWGGNSFHEMKPGGTMELSEKDLAVFLEYSSSRYVMLE